VRVKQALETQQQRRALAHQAIRRRNKSRTGRNCASYT